MSRSDKGLEELLGALLRNYADQNSGVMAS